jgi:predicted ester cyclase
MTTSPDPLDPKAVLTAWLAVADESQDPNAALDWYRDPCEMIGPGGSEARTPRQVRDFAQGFATTLSDIRHEVTNWIVSGDRAAIEFTLSGVHSGPFASDGREIPPTGKPVKLRCAGLYRIVSGRIAEAHLYFDRLELMTQLGAI